MKRIFNFSATANLVLVSLSFLFADYSVVNCQTAITATVPFQNNGLASGTFRIFLKTNSGNTTQLTTPIIIVEGIDFFEQFPAFATNERTIFDLLNTPRSHFLADRLRNEGFDVVILNWNNSGDFLQKNAFLVVRLIEEVNRLKVGNEPNVLVGISMGGVVSRYALTWMEQNGRTHDVRDFISYDSPQLGANFPLGLQFWTQSIGAFNTSVLNIAELAGVRSFNSESSKQMLKYHLTGLNNVPGTGNVISPIANHTNFYNEIEGLNNNLGYPRNCRNVAISNGAKKGLGFGAAGLAIAYGTGLFSGFVSDVPTQPGSNRSALFEQKTPLNQTFTAMVPVAPEQDYDNAPGGFINWYKIIGDGMVSQGIPVTVGLNQQNVSFVPTQSALGLKDPNLYRDINAWQNHENQIPFDSYYSPQLGNQSHVDLPTVTANWLHLQITSPDLWEIRSRATSFNFGVNTNDFVFNNTDVSDGGILGINTNRRTDAYEFNNSPATQQPLPNNLGFDNWFAVQTSAKRPVTIAINNGGSLELGSAQTNGLLKIKTGSTLRFRSGSRLSQMFNSRIEIENGGRLIIDAGANINLADNNCSVIIKSGGELIINGQFVFTGNGHFRFEQNNTFTLNSNLILRGPARTNPIIKIANGATLTVSNPFELQIIDGTVFRESASFAQRTIWLRNGATFRANNVVFDGQSAALDQAAFVEVENPFDTNNDPDDVDYSFVNCRFQNAKLAVKMHVPSANAVETPFDWRNVNLQFITCDFANCQALVAVGVG